MTTIRQPEGAGCGRKVHAAFSQPLGADHVLNAVLPEINPPTTLAELLTAFWLSRRYEQDAFVWAAGQHTDLDVDQIADEMTEHLRPTKKGVLKRVASLSPALDGQVQSILAHACLRLAARRYGGIIGPQIVSSVMAECHRLMSGYDPARGGLDGYLVQQNQTGTLTWDESRILGLRRGNTTSLDALLERHSYQPVSRHDPQIVSSRQQRRSLLDPFREVYPDVFEHYEEGVPQQEIARRRGLTKQAINNRITRGVRAIRDALRRQGFHHSNDL